MSLKFYPGDQAGLIVLQSAEIIEFSDKPQTKVQAGIETAGAAEPTEIDVPLPSESPSKTVSNLPIETEIPVDVPKDVTNEIKSEKEKATEIEASVALEPNQIGSHFSIESQPPSNTDLPADTELSHKDETDDILPGTFEGQSESNPDLDYTFKIEAVPILSQQQEKPRTIRPSIAVNDFSDGRIFQR
ncbi:MAG: hypothetical protein GY850_05720, partial [bacterium]|nr:hypothetical protein [bacterium]